VAEDPATREIVGVARYVRTADDAATADLAVAVVDAWHRRGVGRRLMTELIRQARGDGVARVMGTTLVDNHPSHGLLRSLGFEPAASSATPWTSCSRWARARRARPPRERPQPC
jgi:GNAT superfamily N-acetyltransferase